MLVMFVGPQGVPLAGKFIYPGETREVSEAQLLSAVQAHPGWFEVQGVPVFPPSLEDVEIDGEVSAGDEPAPVETEEVVVSEPAPVETEEVVVSEPAPVETEEVVVSEPAPIEVADVSSIEHDEQPVTKRRGGSKRGAK